MNLVVLVVSSKAMGLIIGRVGWKVLLGSSCFLWEMATFYCWKLECLSWNWMLIGVIQVLGTPGMATSWVSFVHFFEVYVWIAHLLSVRLNCHWKSVSVWMLDFFEVCEFSFLGYYCLTDVISYWYPWVCELLLHRLN